MGQGFTKGIPLDTDGTLSSNSDQLVPSQKSVKTYVDARATGTNTGDETNATIKTKLGAARGLTTHTGSFVVYDGSGYNTTNHATNNSDKGTSIIAIRIA